MNSHGIPHGDLLVFDYQKDGTYDKSQYENNINYREILSEQEVLDMIQQMQPIAKEYQKISESCCENMAKKRTLELKAQGICLSINKEYGEWRCMTFPTIAFYTLLHPQSLANQKAAKAAQNGMVTQVMPAQQNYTGDYYNNTVNSNQVNLGGQQEMQNYQQ